MRLCTLLVFLRASLLALAKVEGDGRYLQASAVVSDPDGYAQIECWNFSIPFSTYPTIGASIFLANTSNTTYVVLPPRSNEGLHKPPHPMLFVLLSGLAHVTLPRSSDDLWIVEGVNPVIVATDTIGVGHFTEYPSNKETVALQIPFEGGEVPKHEVIHQCACKDSVRPPLELHRSGNGEEVEEL